MKITLKSIVEVYTIMEKKHFKYTNVFIIIVTVLLCIKLSQFVMNVYAIYTQQPPKKITYVKH